MPHERREAHAIYPIRSLGRTDVADMVERNCAQARRMAEHLAAIPGAGWTAT
ncbi:hypothetical protein [Mycolicibacterium doricum]|uniref:hypothetical protein n=1 Tax=Mycolicibacterium doricum TaxID=126673 RepID=UPI0013D5040B|nr:hypothetical protein [Mycolicibacterium doricum]MCV7269491.1 hypothetical protein [Mycolicibacterium doricum]